ncbi:lysophospholipid acyltransferase family protein [Mycobacterium sp.]|uniref:lysophospholipid acyltransferase family protein n=1 Tax=Mycobacterium sp. TaxID=1785 RepID=UPI003A8816E2
MAEPFFRFMEFFVPSAVALNGNKITYRGLENIPAEGGAIIALNHTSYVDWIPGSLAALQRKRRLRFMLKAEMQQVRSVNFVIKHTGLIPVDRTLGADAYAVAVQRLKEGEVVGMHPEGTISRSLELREFKTGAARMAMEAQVPVVPMIVWGAHRIWPRAHPKNLWRNKIPVSAELGPALWPESDVDGYTETLRQAMEVMLHRVQEEYPHPAGEFWVPSRLGGGAPTPEESGEFHIANLAEPAQNRDQGEAATKNRDKGERH